MRSMFLSSQEVAELLNVSLSHAYKVVRAMNKELNEKGYFTIAGRVDRKYFYEKFYGTRSEDERSE